MDYIIYGAGGHAKVVHDILRANGASITGVMDDHLSEDQWNGLRFLGNIQSLENAPDLYKNKLFIVAIGHNETREKVAASLEKLGLRFGNAIHPSAIIGSNCFIGVGTVIMPNAVVNADTVIGKHVIINTSSSVDHDCEIRDYTHISPGAHLAGGVVVGKGTHIGIGASVIPKVKIGSGTIVGAGAAVIHDLPDYIVAVGVPAIIKNH